MRSKTNTDTWTTLLLQHHQIIIGNGVIGDRDHRDRMILILKAPIPFFIKFMDSFPLFQLLSFDIPMADIYMLTIP